MPRSRPAPLSLALFLALAATPPSDTAAQSFTAITSGHPVTTLGGHRSASWIDMDGDGDLDLHVTRGGSVGENDDLYRNDGGGTFTPDSTNALAQDGLRSVGATWGDYDNDGDTDVFSTSWHGEVNGLWDNVGSGAFQRVLTGPVVTTGSFSESGSWVDYDNDSDLDLFVANSGTPPVGNFLYRNDGSGSFVPLSSGPVVTDPQLSRHGAWGDWDDDGDVDLFVANESNQANRLYKNLLVETGTADFQAEAAGTLTTELTSSFSASWGDFDNDGDLDLIVANHSGQNDGLYRNELVETGIPTMTKLVAAVPSTIGGWTVSSMWGDFDNDGDLDLVMTNGFSTTPGQTRRNFILRNDGGGVFVRDLTSPPATDVGWSYSASLGDYDADGDLDLFVANWQDNAQANWLYRNDAEASGNHWLQVRCVGTASNRSGIGTKIRATATIGGTPVTQTRHVSGSDGYCSHNLVQHFGLGDATTVDVVLRWPSGTMQAIHGVAADQLLTVVEESSVGVAETLGSRPLGLRARPNPFRASTVFAFDLPTAAPVRLDVFDAAGRRVRSLARGERSAGAHEVTWDGRNNGGTKVGPGVYFYRLTTVDRSVTGKVSRVE